MASQTIISIQRDENGKKELIVKHISEDGTTVKAHEADSRRILDSLINGDSEDIYIDRIPETGPLPTQPTKTPTQPATNNKVKGR
jgi:hypothetical protein